MTKLTTENFFSTQLTVGVDDSIVWEIEYQLAVAPQSDVWYLIIDYLDSEKREEVFYHRKAWTSIFQYWVNRTNPQVHAVSASVQLNDSSSIFNYIINLLPDHYFMYKTWVSSMYIKGWKIYDNWSYYTIPDVTDLTFSIWTNYLYIDDFEIKTTTDSLSDKLIFGDVIVDWSWFITTFNNYNTISSQTGRPNIILRWSGSPSVGEWIVWDYYVDDTNKRFYWPKIEWDWGSSFSIEWAPWDNWAAWTIAVWTVNTWVAWSDVDIENVWTSSEAILNFTIPKWDAWDIAEAPEWEESTIKDNTIPEWVTVTTNSSTYIKVTLPNWDYTKYLLTKIIVADANNNIYSEDTLSWTFWADWIAYANWLFVHKVTWYTNFTGTVMYKNFSNHVTWVNTFNNTTIFKWPVSLQYYVTTWATLFDVSKWTKQAMNISSWAAETLDFTNLIAWCTLLLAINVTSSAITLTKWTATWTDQDWAPKSYTYYNISWDTYPINLAVWTHIFVLEVFTNWIHISYVGESVAI